MTKVAHSRLPWAIETPLGNETPWLVEAGTPSSEWRCIAQVCADGVHGDGEIALKEGTANAEFLVHAANTYYDLIAALKDARQFIENGVDYGFIDIPDDDPAQETLPKIKAALAKAGVA